MKIILPIISLNFDRVDFFGMYRLQNFFFVNSLILSE